METSTRGLCLKLLARLHLNVEERQLLPGGRAPFTELVAAVRQHLAAADWFPHRLPPDGLIGEGVLLERRGDEIWTHHQHEVGVGRYSQIHSARVGTLEEGVQLYIQANGGASVDGVPIDWSS